MKAYIFPGQGSQFVGMGKDLHQNYSLAKEYFDVAGNILGFDIAQIMFEGTPEELAQTKVTQPAVFIHSVVMAMCMKQFKPDMVAGHSLGEFSALVASQALSFEEGLSLVHKRALAMQEACELAPSSMAAVLGLEDAIIEDICEKTPGVVVAANYNCPGQLVISGEIKALEAACESLKQAGAKRALILPVGGGFHSPMMESAAEKLKEAIFQSQFKAPICPIYQNVSQKAETDPQAIQDNLVAQLTSAVKWTQSIQQMILDGATSFTEVGPGKALSGMVKKINSEVEVHSAEI
ncbi:MAG: [acyl-carrier-protein] S-malonyltransferase [Flavobacteriaceae bacterium]|nr:MAG: [acyl-carrier-protein] S-malonyltransferase [Flavobacteriaceae bacterium]